MPNRQAEQRKVYGLALQSNSFNVPEGSFEKLDNCVVTQDDIIRKRRGASLFYNIGASVSGRNLSFYDDKLIGFCDDVVQVYNQDGSGNFASLSSLGGAAFTIASGKKARNVPSNGNLYFTADQGVFKLESSTADVLEAGVEPATDIQVFLTEKSASETFFRPDSQIGYRVVFGRKDANNNTVLGSPSQFISSVNSPRTDAATLAATTVTVNATAHGLAVSDVIYVFNADSTGVPDGNYTVATTPTANQFTFSANTGSAGTTLSWGTFKTPSLDWDIPDGLSDEFFWRLYRTSTSASSDIEPDESTLQLVDEQNLTSAQVTTGFVIYKDETPDLLRGAFLYTNPNTGEPRGILEANEKPPKCTDVALFKNAVFYANVETQYTLGLNLLASNSTDLPDLCEFTVTSGVTTRTYIGHLDPKVGNRTVRATSVSFLLAVVTITYNSHGLNNGDTVSVAQALDSTGAQLSTLPQGNYTVSNITANTFDITAPATPTGLVAISFSGVATAAGKRIFYIENSATTSVASAIGTTARAIVRAINRDASSPVFGYYTSTADGIPGQMLLRSEEVTATFYLNAVTAAIVNTFNPPLPTSGQDAIGTRDEGAGLMFFSKPAEPEAVPFVNQILVGSKSSAILRIAPLRDSLIVFKEDGVFRINGDNYSNFVATVLDSTVSLKATDSLAILDNQVYILSDQGVCAVGETTASIVSRAIEPLFTSIVGKSTTEGMTHAVSYESERLYIITTTSPTATEPDRVYVYNHLTRAWTTWNDTTFLDGFINPADDRFYSIDLDNVIFRERKNQNRLDYTGRDYSGTVTDVPADNRAEINISGAVGAVGDIVEFNDILSRITAVDTASSIYPIYTFAQDVTFVATDTVTLYKSITSSIRTSPYYGGTVSILKQFSELQLGFRNGSSFTVASIYFLSDYTATGATTWSSNTTTGGWGFEPWGAFPWGLEEGLDTVYDTSPSQHARIFIPLEVQRGMYIQTDITHSVAGQDIALQSLSYTARPYRQRTTR
jgi:hypothetical protein